MLALAWVMPCADAEAGERRLRDAFASERQEESMDLKAGLGAELGRRGLLAGSAPAEGEIERKTPQRLTLRVRSAELRETTRRLEALGARPATGGMASLESAGKESVLAESRSEAALPDDRPADKLDSLKRETERSVRFHEAEARAASREENKSEPAAPAPSYGRADAEKAEAPGADPRSVLPEDEDSLARLQSEASRQQAKTSKIQEEKDLDLSIQRKRMEDLAKGLDDKRRGKDTLPSPLGEAGTQSAVGEEEWVVLTVILEPVPEAQPGGGKP
jgi:hypothetical protein